MEEISGIASNSSGSIGPLLLGPIAVAKAASALGRTFLLATKYRARVSKGFQVLDRLNFKVADPKAVKDFRAEVVPVADTRRHVFGGFKRCLYPYQSFQSDEERRFAVLIDSVHEPDVLRWVKPGSKQFQIEYRRTCREYGGEPAEPPTASSAR
jgi:hypothetical protein